MLRPSARVLLLLLVTPFCAADTQNHSLPGIDAVIKATEEHRKVRSSPGTLPDPKTWRKAGVCSYEGLCEYFGHNALKPYLYKDSGGYGVPNRVFMAVDDSIRECLKSGSSPALAAAKKAFEESLDPEEKKKFHQSAMRLSMPELLTAEPAPTLDFSDAAEEAMEKPESAPSTEKPGKPSERYSGILDDESKEKYDYYSKLLDEGIEKIGPALDKWDPFENDYLLNSELFEKESNKEDFGQKSERVGAIFESIRRDLLKLLNDRRTKQNGADMDELMKRVETVALKVPTPGSSMPGGCHGGGNAFYVPSLHTVTLCPQMLRFPALTIREILSHEMGHSIDPCACTCPLTHRKSDEETDILPDGSLKLFSLTDSDTGPKFTTITPKNSTPLRSRTDEMARRSDDRLLLHDEKIIGHSVDKNPFQEVVDCLTEKTSVAARTHDPKVISAEFNKALASSSLPKDAKKKSMKNFTDSIEQRLACNDSVTEKLKVGSDQRAEAFADWIARTLGSNHLTNNVVDAEKDGKKENETLEYLALNAASCPEIEDTVMAYFENIAEKAGCRRSLTMPEAAQNHGVLNTYLDSHPSTADRYEKIFLADPKMAKLLGCPVTKGTRPCS